MLNGNVRKVGLHTAVDKSCKGPMVVRWVGKNNFQTWDWHVFVIGNPRPPKENLVWPFKTPGALLEPGFGPKRFNPLRYQKKGDLPFGIPGLRLGV